MVPLEEGTMKSAAIDRQHPTERRPAAAPLRVSGVWARLPWMGILMVFIGGLIFGALTYNLQTDGPLLQWDVPLANSLHAQALQAPSYAKPLMILGFYLGREVIVVVAVLLGLFYLVKRYWRELWMMAVGFGGAALWWFWLSHLFNRPRPLFPSPIWMQLQSGSYPSGHTLSAVVAYTFLAYMLASQTRSRLFKWMYALLALAIILFIGYSRLYLGDHYLSDILAGYALGLAWAGLVYTVIETIFRKRNRTHVIEK